ncbi:MAG TPA: hypothetical protein VNP20_12810 [Nocardioidaceae bacterium]|nr:hypothetical protein [Nocardioidaceae bacterium]
MNIKSVLIASAAIVAGVSGAVAAYQFAAPASGSETAGAAAVVAAPDQTQRGKQAREKKFAPCKPPAKLEGKKCVTTEVRTVMVGGASSSLPAPAAPSPSGHDSGDDGSHDSGGFLAGRDDDSHHSGEGEDGHHGDDDDDDDNFDTFDTRTDDDGSGTHTRTRTGHDD